MVLKNTALPFKRHDAKYFKRHEANIPMPALATNCKHSKPFQNLVFDGNFLWLKFSTVSSLTAKVFNRILSISFLLTHSFTPTTLHSSYLKKYFIAASCKKSFFSRFFFVPNPRPFLHFSRKKMRVCARRERLWKPQCLRFSRRQFVIQKTWC